MNWYRRPLCISSLCIGGEPENIRPRRPSLFRVRMECIWFYRHLRGDCGTGCRKSRPLAVSCRVETFAVSNIIKNYLLRSLKISIKMLILVWKWCRWAIETLSNLSLSFAIVSGSSRRDLSNGIICHFIYWRLTVQAKSHSLLQMKLLI